MVTSGELTPKQGIDYCNFWEPRIVLAQIDSRTDLNMREDPDGEDPERWAAAPSWEARHDIENLIKYPVLKDLLQLRFDLEVFCGQAAATGPLPDLAPSTPDPAPLQSGTFQRLRWLGAPSSWERVYEALTDAGLIDPSPSAWAGHFITETGGPMKPPKGGTAILGEAKDPKVWAAVAVIRKQE